MIIFAGVAQSTALVCVLLLLFAYNNLDAMKDTTAQRFGTLQGIKEFDSGGAAETRKVRDLIEPTLTPATYDGVRRTHVISDLLTIAALGAIELRRRRLPPATGRA